MNEKIKKFYYSLHKSNESEYLNFLFKNMSTILQYSKFLSFFYILFVFLNYIQSIFIVLELSYDYDTHSHVKKYTRYLYLVNYLNNENMSESTYFIFIYINFLIIIIPIILFFILCLNIPKKLIKLISISLSIYMFFEKYIYYIFSFSILLSPFKLKNNSFDSNNSDDGKYIAIKIFSLLLFIIKLIISNVIIFLFTDYSIFKKKVPWSSPLNFIDISFLYLNVYIILAGYFFNNYTLLILVINIGISSYIIYNRIQCPFYFLTKLNYFKFYCEGSIICIDIIYPLLSYFNKSWINYDLIYLYLFVIFFGIVYAILIIYIDYNLLKKLNKKIKSYILLNKIDQYEMYIFLIKICDIIKKSIEDRESSNLLFYFYSQHRIECDDQNCFCLKIDELINMKQLNLEEYINYRNKNNEIYADEEEDLKKNKDEYIINDKEVFDDSFKRKKLITLNRSEKHIKLWGNLIQSILEKVINLNNNTLNNSDYLRIDYSNFLSFYLEKYVHSLIEISNVNKNNLPFYFQYYLYYSKNDLLDSNKNKEIFQREIDVNYKKILEYNRYYEKFLKIIKITSELSVNFWSEMKKNIFQPKIFENRGYTISKNTTKLEKYSKLILANNSNDIRTLKIYGTFLNHVLKLQDESKGYMDKAFLQIVMNDDTDNINNHSLNLTNFFDNQLDSSIIVVNGNKENIGRVEYVNYYFTNLFGFSKKEIVGKNVSTIMPTNIGKYHNQFMLNFYTTTKTKFLNKTRREIGLNKEKLIHPIMIYVKIFPCIEEGISYIGLIKKTTFSNITKGSRQIRRSTNIGFIMTTVDNKLIHYNKLIEEKFQLIPSLMYEDTKDISEEFKIEMIFPEFLNNKKNILNEIKNEEKRCFFTTKVIEMSKRMEYSKLYSIVKEELEYYNEMVKKLKIELKKNNINDSSFMTKSNKSGKTFRNKKLLLANKIENSEFIKKNTALVSLTEFNYIMNANFLIYQIVFDKSNNINITNVIKNYQQKLLNPTEKSKNATGGGGILKSGFQNKKNSKTISNYLPSMMSVKSTMNTTDIMTSSNKKGLLFNALSEVRNNTFKKKQPLTLLLITLVIIGMLFMIMIYVIGEFVIILIRTAKSSKSLNTVNNLGLINIDLTFLQSSIYLYGLIMIKELNDFQTNINNLNFSVLLNKFINIYLNDIVSVKDNINQESKFDSELSYNLTESINSFYTFYDDISFIVNKESVINSITNIINYYNNLMDILTYNYSSITINEIMIRSSNEENYDINSLSDIQLNVIKNLKTIYYNFQLIIKQYLEILIISLLSKNTKVTFDDFESLMTIFFIIEIVINILFTIGYCILYYILINLRINILKIFTEISPETEKNCLDDVIKYNKNIEMIIQNDIYFLENYYDNNNNTFQIEKKKNNTNSSPDNTSITNNNLNNINKYNDYNLGLEEENSDIKQIFNDYKKKKPISIKKYIEEQNNKETISPTQNNKKDEDNRSINQIYNQKKRESDLKNINIYNFKINNNSHLNQLTKENSKNNLISNFDTEELLLNTTENDNKLNSSNNYRKRIIKKKAQLNKIISYRKEKCFDYIIILIILTLLIFYILVYFIPKYLLNNISYIFKELKYFCIFKFYFISYYPLFINYLVNSEILHDNFSDILMIYYKNSSYYYNQNNIFFLNKKNKFKKLADLYTELKIGNKSCSYISDYYNEEIKNSIFNYCIKNYFKNGEDSAIIEDLTIGLNHYNYIKDLILDGKLDSIIERKNQLKNQTLINIFIYNMLIFNPYYKNFEKDYIDYLKDSVKKFKYFFLVKMFIGFIFGLSLLFFYIKYIRIKYLNQYIYTKAMILLVPQNELLKGDNYAAIQKLIGNDK